MDLAPVHSAGGGELLIYAKPWPEGADTAEGTFQVTDCLGTMVMGW